MEQSPRGLKAIRWLCWLAVATFAIASFYLGCRCNFDTHDGYAFLTQSRRLTDPAFAISAYEWVRPRGLVLFLSFFESLAKLLTGYFPDVRAYHLLMTSVSVFTLAAWVQVGKRWFGAAVGYLTGILLALDSLFFSFSMAILSDVLTAGLWGLSLILFIKLDRCFDTKANRRFLAIALGTTLGLLALSKYQYFFLPPLFIVALFFAMAWLRVSEDLRYFYARQLGIVSLAYVIAVDLGQRLLGQFYSGFWFTPKMYIAMAKEILNQTFQHESAWVYARDFHSAFGGGFIALTVLVIAYRLRKLKTDPLPRSPKFLLKWVFLAVNLIYVVFIQSIQHREPRYIFPLIPPLLCLVAYCFIYFWTTQIKWRPWALILFVVALVHPLRQLPKVFWTYENDAALRRKIDYAKFWNYLDGAATGGKSCRQVFACQTEIQRPEYLYRIPTIPITAEFCQRIFGEFRGQLSRELEDNACYVLADSRISEQPPNPVEVEKIVGISLSENQAERLKQLPRPDGENLICEKSTREDHQDCFLHRTFFNPLIF
jgi:hypothetical protein